MNASAPSVSREHIAKTPGICGGKACIAGTRVRVQDVIAQYEQGMPPEQIASHFAAKLTLAEVYAALAYGLDHADEIASDRQRDQESADEYFNNRPSKLGQALNERNGE